MEIKKDLFYQKKKNGNINVILTSKINKVSSFYLFMNN